MSETERVFFGAPLIYGLKTPHAIGSVCGVPCEQCGGDEVVMTGVGSVGVIEPQPLYIIRAATYEEYVASCRANGGGTSLSLPGERYYYEVSAD